MIDSLDNSLLKARIIGWIIFGIPVVLFFVFSIQFLLFINSDQWDVMLIASGGNAQSMIPVIIISGISFFSVFSVSFFFFGRYFVERSKNKILRREVARLNQSNEEQVYPDRLEDLKT